MNAIATTAPIASQGRVTTARCQNSELESGRSAYGFPATYSCYLIENRYLVAVGETSPLSFMPGYSDKFGCVGGLQEGWVFPSLRGTLKTPGSLSQNLGGLPEKAIGVKERFTSTDCARHFNDLTSPGGSRRDGDSGC